MDSKILVSFEQKIKTFFSQENLWKLERADVTKTYENFCEKLFLKKGEFLIHLPGWKNLIFPFIWGGRGHVA